jgi:hypothetical protein
MNRSRWGYHRMIFDCLLLERLESALDWTYYCLRPP